MLDWHFLYMLIPVGNIFKTFRLKKNYNDFVPESSLLNYMIGISKHTLLDSNDIFKEFKNSVTEQLQNGFVD